MIQISFILNIILLIGMATVVLYYLVQRKYSSQLFSRAWVLEKKLIEIYDITNEEEVKKHIQHTLDTIKPL